MGEHDNGYVDTLSGNDIGNPGMDNEGMEIPETPDTGNSDPSGNETPGQGEDTGSDKPDTGHDTEDKDDKEESDSADQEQIITVIEDDDSKEWREGISEQLAELMKPQDTTDVTERLDNLIMLLTPEEDEAALQEAEPHTVTIPFEGHTGWDYPINVQFQVYPYGAGYWMKQTEGFSDVDSFMARYEEIINLCQEGGTLKDFYVEYIWDCSEELVYDHEAQTSEPEPDPGEEEQKEITDKLLTHLEDINTTLSDMVQANMEYYQEVRDHQTEMQDLNRINTACNIVVSVGVFCIFALLLWSEFFRRFK